MNNKTFIQSLSQSTGINQDEAQRMIYTLIDIMSAKFQENAAVNIPNFGTFEVKKRMERIMNNPGTQQRMLVPPKIVLCFKAANTLKEQLKTGGQTNG